MAGWSFYITRMEIFFAESFIAYEGSRYGVYISTEDVDGDGVAEIITAAGPEE